MTEDRTQSGFNQNEAIIKRIDALTNDVIRLRLLLRHDGRVAQNYLDLLGEWWQEVNAIASMEDNSNTYKEDIEEFKQLKNELYGLAPREVRRAQKRFATSFQTVGVSEDFLLKATRLKELLVKLSQRFGFGMSTKRYESYDWKASTRRAAE